MKNLIKLVIISIAAVGVMSAAHAAKPAGVKVTGGGVVENNNSGVFPEGDIFNFYGFVAMARGAGVTNGNAMIWETAKGQVDAETSDTLEPAENPLATVHGEVVCMADLGPGNTVGHDSADNSNSVWEIRFEIVDSGGIFQLPVRTCGGPCYGSLFVQDNATPGAQGDLGDENFDIEFISDPRCNLGQSFELEDVIAGNIKDHTQ